MAWVLILNISNTNIWQSVQVTLEFLTHQCLCQAWRQWRALQEFTTLEYMKNQQPMNEDTSHSVQVSNWVIYQQWAEQEESTFVWEDIWIWETPLHLGSISRMENQVLSIEINIDNKWACI